MALMTTDAITAGPSGPRRKTRAWHGGVAIRGRSRLSVGRLHAPLPRLRRSTGPRLAHAGPGASRPPLDGLSRSRWRAQHAPGSSHGARGHGVPEGINDEPGSPAACRLAGGRTRRPSRGATRRPRVRGALMGCRWAPSRLPGGPAPLPRASRAARTLGVRSGPRTPSRGRRPRHGRSSRPERHQRGLCAGASARQRLAVSQPARAERTGPLAAWVPPTPARPLAGLPGASATCTAPCLAAVADGPRGPAGRARWATAGVAPSQVRAGTTGQGTPQVATSGCPHRRPALYGLTTARVGPEPTGGLPGVPRRLQGQPCVPTMLPRGRTIANTALASRTTAQPCHARDPDPLAAHQPWPRGPAQDQARPPGHQRERNRGLQPDRPGRDARTAPLGPADPLPQTRGHRSACWGVDTAAASGALRQTHGRSAVRRGVWVTAEHTRTHPRAWTTAARDLAGTPRSGPRG
jgi:hypothetical protein